MLDSNGLLLCRTFRKVVRSDRDVVGAITGNEGEGKSALAIDMGKNCDPRFDIEQDEVGTTKKQEMLDKMMDKKRYGCVVVDEAIKKLYKQNWQSKSQRFLNQLYTLCRQENKITILCLPRFIDLNEFFRNHRVKYWIHIVQRGTAVAFMRDWSPFTKDPWWMAENQKIIDASSRGKSIVDIDVEDKLKILSKSKNFLMDFKFTDFDPEDKEKYLRCVGSKKYEGNLDDEDVGETDAMKRVRLQRDKLIEMMVRRGAKQTEMMKEIGLSPNAIREARMRATPSMSPAETSIILNNYKPKKKFNFLR